ncbi:MAG TPA: NAD(P)H-dependent oxidoreductase subunit E, partial [Chloroflexota bacterium]|nr:NAD(P)H-dependent oxidoreductase subunit E [Chloroflexota bacterium]
MLSEETVQEIRAAMKRYPRSRSAVLDTLRAIQRQFGYCEPEALNEAAEILGIDANALQMLVTFYDLFYEHPVGEHILMPCKNITCFLRGSDQLIAH